MRRFVCLTLGATLALAAWLTPSEALETTWVATFGDDGNSCNPTTPCRFLPRALQAVDPGGRIYVLDSGHFAGQGLVITKAVSIIARGVLASLSGTGLETKITINAGPKDNVYLEGLQISGNHGGVEGDGIVFNNGAQLHLRNCTIHGFPSSGIRIHAPGSRDVIVSNCTIYDNKFGVSASTRGSNGALGVMVDGSTISANSHSGIRGLGSATHIRINNSKIVDNVRGLVSLDDARLISFGNNIIERNGTNGAPTHSGNLK